MTRAFPPRRYFRPTALVRIGAVAAAVAGAVLAGALPVGATTPSTSTSTSTSSTITPTTTVPATTAPTTTVPRVVVPPTAPPPPVTTILPTVTGLSALQLDAIDTEFVMAVQAEVGAAQQADDAAQAAKTQADQRAAAAATALSLAAQRVDDLDTASRQAAAAVQAAHDRLRNFAVAAYVTGGPGTPLSALLSSDSIGEYARRKAVLSSVADESTATLDAYTKARASAGKATLKSVDALQAAQAAKVAADQADAQATAVAAQAATLLAQRRNLLNLASDAISIPGTDVPALVLDAYRRAALALSAKGCKVAWWALAGIGKVESDHGRAQHAQLSPTGDLVPRILGPALDGTNGTQAIPATAGGKYTGDPVWDHAVGPMQFIPSTWLEWGRDGNGDGNADPNNIYDAALGTASYLCAASSDLTTDAGLETAYFSYNHSADYVAEVLAYARAYQAADASGNVPALAPQPLYTLAPTTTAPPPGQTTTTTSAAPPAAGGTPVGPPGGAASPNGPPVTAGH